MDTLKDIHIEPINLKHLEIIKELDTKLMNPVWSANNLKRAINSNDFHNFIFFHEKSGEVIGFLITGFYENQAKIFKIAVDTHFQGKGYGKKILKFFFEYAYDNGIEEIYLDVATRNLKAYSLYKKLGFKKIGIKKNYYKNPSDDAILMYLDLNEIFEGNDEH